MLLVMLGIAARVDGKTWRKTRNDTMVALQIEVKGITSKVQLCCDVSLLIHPESGGLRKVWLFNDAYGSSLQDHIYAVSI